MSKSTISTFQLFALIPDAETARLYLEARLWPQGWAPEFAAGCVLRYLRRDKDHEHSIESARWYWRQLIKISDDSQPHVPGWERAPRIFQDLTKLLTAEEFERLS